MQFLALLTLTILLLVNFMQSGSFNEHQVKSSNSHKITLVGNEEHSITDQRPVIAVNVLGNYVSSYETAIAKNNDQFIEESTVEETLEHSAILDPTPTFSKPNENLIPTTPTPVLEKIETKIEITNNASKLLNKINSYRGENGLPAFSYNQTVCEFSKLRARELASDFSHSGFRNRVDNGNLPYKDYSHVAENIASTDTADRAFELWKNSSGHNKNMLDTSTYGCIGNSGRFYTLEIWEP